MQSIGLSNVPGNKPNIATQVCQRARIESEVVFRVLGLMVAGPGSGIFYYLDDHDSRVVCTMDCGVTIRDSVGCRRAFEKSEKSRYEIHRLTPNRVSNENCYALQPVVVGGTRGHKTSTYVATSN